MWRNYLHYAKTSGISVVFLGGYWMLYQLRQVSRIIRSAVHADVLDLEQTHAQYIYIEDPRFKDIFMFQKDDSSQATASEKRWGLVNSLLRRWKIPRRNVTYRLLHMAQHGDTDERWKAVNVLGNLTYLKDWEYHHLAQMLDAKTAVALARMPNVNPKFFLQPPYYHSQHDVQDLLEKIHSLLVQLNNLSDNTHLCLTQFLGQRFKDIHREVFDHDLISVGLSMAPVRSWDDELFKSCIQAICHHSSVEPYSKHLVDLGALPLLTAIEKISDDDVEVSVLLAKIISNISLHTEYLENIFQSDESVLNHAMDYLSTMSDDDRPQEFFKDLARDLQLREWKKIGQDFEVILDDCPRNANFCAHGPYSCCGDDICMQDDHKCSPKTLCWPKDWLSKDIPLLRVIGINYDTNLSMWTRFCPIENMKSTIKQRSEEYVTKLIMANVGHRPLVWVGHSMGGLLVKRMLVDEWKAGDKHGICKNTKAVLFYGTPHRGSQIAALTYMTQILVWPSIEVQELREESPNLLRLHEEFLKMLKEYDIEIVSFAETKSTLITALKFPFQFVTLDSADPGVGEFFEIPQDHLSICKPASRQSFLYQKLLNILRRQIKSKK